VGVALTAAADFSNLPTEKQGHGHAGNERYHQASPIESDRLRVLRHLFWLWRVLLQVIIDDLTVFSEFSRAVVLRAIHAAQRLEYGLCRQHAFLVLGVVQFAELPEKTRIGSVLNVRCPEQELLDNGNCLVNTSAGKLASLARRQLAGLIAAAVTDEDQWS